MPQSNVEATAFILDISPSAADSVGGGNRFLDEAINCMVRVMERKIFSRPDDLVCLVLMGSEESNNGMYKKGSEAYQNISIATELSTPTWDLIDLLKNKLKLSKSTGDWIDALIVSADYLTSTLNTLGTKVSCKQIVLMTDFKTKTTIELDQLKEVLDGFNAGGINLIFIGSSILEDDEENSQHVSVTDNQEYNLIILSNIVEELESVKLSFDEASIQLRFHKKKAVNARPWNVDLSIGGEIKIPISAYGRIRDEKPVKIPWTKVFSRHGNVEGNKTACNINLIPVETKRTYHKADDNMDIVDKDNIISGYAYGDKTIPFTDSDKTMNYQSGEKGLICYGFTKRENINCSHLTDNGITYVVGRKDNQNATVAIESLATMLHQNKFVMIARKVYYKGSAPRMVALFPIIKKDYKCLSMVTLAYREDHRHMLLPGLNQKKFAPNDEQLAAVDDLIKSMDLSRRGEDGKEVFSIEANINPTLQYEYDSIAYRALNPGKPLCGPRPEVQKLLEVPSCVAKLAAEPLQKIKELFPLVVIEKTSGRKEWIDKHLSGDDKKEDINKLPDVGDITAASVLVNQVNKIGTVNPAGDFKELVKVDRHKACDELKEVIEKLVTYSISEDYSKPISALREMRLSCIGSDVAVYNDWLIKFKEILLERFNENFLNQMFENKLGLITTEENSSSTVTQTVAKNFEDFTVSESISKPSEIDDMDDLFD